LIKTTIHYTNFSLLSGWVLEAGFAGSRFTEFYIVPQKTSHLWLAMTLTHMNGFWYFLAEMLPKK